MKNDKEIKFWKTISFSSVAMLIKLCGSFVVAKLIAVFVGAATFGLFGQFLSFVSLVQLGSGGILGTGVSKYVSSHHADRTKLTQLITTALKFTFISSVILGGVISSSATRLSILIFHSPSFSWLFFCFGICLLGASLNAIILAIFTGLNSIVDYAVVIIAGAFISVIMIGVLGFYFRTEGVLLGYVFAQLAICFVAIFKFYKLPVRYLKFREKIDFNILKKIIRFSSMNFVSILTLPLAQMFLRTYVANHSSWSMVGYWQGMLKVSDAYLLLATTAISTYALPSYSRKNNKKALVDNVCSVLFRLLPLTIVISLTVFLFRTEVIIILFDKSFLIMKELFAYQLMGDVVKIASWIVINALIVREKIKLFITIELLAVFSYVVLSVFMFNLHGLRGLTEAFFFNYIGYLVLATVGLVMMRRF